MSSSTDSLRRFAAPVEERETMRTRCLFPFLAVVLIAGCNSIGPHAMIVGRSAYNDALATTQSEQLLHNLVRIRYLEMPVFLEVTSVNTQYELRTNANASISGIFDSGLDRSIGSGSLGGSVVERPTVTYAPLQGDDFVKRIMSPMSLETLALMVRSGWRVEHVMTICLQAIGPAFNAPRATGPAHEAEVDNEEFRRIVRLLGEATRSRGGRLSPAPGGGYQMEIDLSYENSIRWLEAMELEPKQVMRVYPGFTLDKSGIALQPRSLLGAMFYLSLGVEMPARHVESGEIPVPPDPRVLDITEDFFTVHSSTSEPESASIKTYYRDHWFYVDDRDFRSKATFALLTLLFSLQSGDRDTATPAITIPLN